MRMTRWPTPPVRGDFGFPIGAAAGVLVTVALVVDGGTHHPALSTVAFAVAIAVLSVLTTPAAVLGTAVLCWFLEAGFVLGRQGEVRITAATDRAALILIVTAVVVSTVVTAIRVTRAWRTPIGSGGPNGTVADR